MINILDFGASTNNLNNLLYIQKAIKFAGRKKTSKVFIPKGTYRIIGSLNLLNNTKIFGEDSTSIIQQNDIAKNIFQIHNANNVSIKNINFVGKGNPSNYGVHSDKGDFQNENGVHILKSENVSITNCHFSNFLANGIYCAYSNNITISDNEFIGNHYVIGSGSDITLYMNVDNAIISNNKCYSNNSQGIGVGINGVCNNIEINNNICIPKYPKTYEDIPFEKVVRRTGIMCGYGVPPYGQSSYYILNNKIYNSTTGIYVNYSNADIVNNHIENVGFGKLNGSGIRSGIKLTDCQKISISGGEIRNFFINHEAITDIDAALAIQGSESNRYCDYRDSHISVDGLKITKSQGAGICMYYKSSKASFKNVMIDSAQKRDIYFDFAADNRVGKLIQFNKCQFNTITQASYYSASSQSNTVINFEGCNFVSQNNAPKDGLYFLLSGQEHEKFTFQNSTFQNYKYGIGIQIRDNANISNLNIAENCTFVDVINAYSLVSPNPKINIQTIGTKLLGRSKMQNDTYPYIKENIKQ